MTEKSRLIIVALLGLTLALSISGVYFATVIFIFFLGISIWQEKHLHWVASPLDVPVAVLLAWGLVVSSFKHEYHILFFFLMAHLASEGDTRTLIRWFLVGSVISAFFGVLQMASGVVYNSTLGTYAVPALFQSWPMAFVKHLAVHADRSVGSRSHPLTYAECLIPAFFLFLPLITNKNRWLPLLGFVLTGLAILCAKGRGVWLGVFVGLFVFSFFLSFKRRLITWGAVTAVVIAIGVLMPGVRGRALSSFSSHEGNVSDQESKELRFYIWREAFQIIKSHWLTGVGAKNVQINFKEVKGYEDHVWSETHNLYLQQAAEKGLIGLGLLLWVFVTAAKSLWSAPEPWRPALLAIFAALLVAGCTESWLGDAEVAMIFWVFLGCVGRLSEKES